MAKGNKKVFLSY